MALTALAWLLSASLVWPQQADQQPAAQQQTQPPATTNPPPANSTPPSPVNPIGSEQQAGQQNAAQPADTRPLAGAQELTPTLPGSGRSYFIPSFSVWEGADSDAQILSGVTKYAAATIPVGSLDLNVTGKTNQFNLDYGGGGIIYDNLSGEDAAFDDLTISDYYNARRWNLLVMNRASYLPQASLGFGGIGFAGIFNTAQSLGLGSGIGQMSQVFVPGQSVLTGHIGTTSDNAVVQTQYFLTSRTSVTGVASYGIMHYAESSLFSGNSRLFVGSIDHQLTGTDTISFSYDLIEYRYSGGSLAFNDNVFQLGYGHRVSSRISLTALAGPALIYTAIRGITGTSKKTTWDARVLIAYTFERGSVNLSYLHYATPGSGVFQGAQTDTATAGVNREITRTWTATVYGSYSHDTALAFSSPSPTSSNPGPINYETGTLRLDRTMGHYMKVFAVYELEHQIAGTAIVPGYSGHEIFRQIFGIGIQVHPRPWGL
jgi:hypothetical protein